jgi:hypothetical protein
MHGTLPRPGCDSHRRHRNLTERAAGHRWAASTVRRLRPERRQRSSTRYRVNLPQDRPDREVSAIPGGVADPYGSDWTAWAPLPADPPPAGRSRSPVNVRCWGGALATLVSGPFQLLSVECFAQAARHHGRYLVGVTRPGSNGGNRGERGASAQTIAMPGPAHRELSRVAELSFNSCHPQGVDKPQSSPTTS